MTSAIIQLNSLYKVAHYVSMISSEKFTVNRQVFASPGVIAISWTFWRDYTCPPGCGGCCRAFTMDYFLQGFVEKLSGENRKPFSLRSFTVNGTEYNYFSNHDSAIQRFRQGLKCQFLDKNGRCKIHSNSPLSCQFELCKLSFSPKRNEAWLGKRIYRNGWRYKRVDGGVGALCKMQPVTAETFTITVNRDYLLIERLCKIADAWSVKHRGWELLEWLHSVPTLNMIKSKKIWRI